ncbi:MAG: hypothetical protein WC137_01345 [Alphaproteobacteria bacterium]
MKLKNKIFHVIIFGFLFFALGISDNYAAETTKSGYKPSDGICASKGKIVSTYAPSVYNKTAEGDTQVTGQEALCNCKLNGGITKKKKEAQKASYAYPNGTYVGISSDYSAARCDTKAIINKWIRENKKFCPGFTEASFAGEHKKITFVSASGCWKWKCADGFVASSTDTNTCVVKGTSTSTITDANGNLVEVAPCDEKTTITVTLNGVKKTVQANSRVGGICVPTCQSDMVSSLDSSDPTQFIIYLNK